MHTGTRTHTTTRIHTHARLGGRQAACVNVTCSNCSEKTCLLSAAETEEQRSWAARLSSVVSWRALRCAAFIFPTLITRLEHSFINVTRGMRMSFWQGRTSASLINTLNSTWLHLYVSRPVCSCCCCYICMRSKVLCIISLCLWEPLALASLISD